MFSMTCTRSARTSFTHSKRFGPAQTGECRRVSPRKTNKSLHYKRILRLGRGIQTHAPRQFQNFGRRAHNDLEEPGASHFRATGKSHTSIATCSFYLTLTESASQLLRFIVLAAH